MKILAIGDVFGNSGIRVVQSNLTALKKEYGADFTVINGENTDKGGILPEQADALFAAGADVITLGNHAWGRRQIVSYIESEPALLRPHNFSGPAPGRGYGIFYAAGKRILVMNLIGRVAMNAGPDNPFHAATDILALNEGKFDIALLDFHAESTSEKLAMGFHLDGRISAVWGTHTHVQTADERIFSQGTGYITDLGMTGPRDSVIGSTPESSLSMFLGGLPERFSEACGPAMINGACFEINTSGRCVGVSRINITPEE